MIREIRKLKPLDLGLGYREGKVTDNAHTFKFESDSDAIH